jgi:hypothetical protein
MKIAYQGRIMQRFMTPAQIKQFENEYDDNRRRNGRVRQVNDKDLMILRAYKSGAMPNELQRKFGMGRGALNTSLRLAALSKIQ